MAISFNQAKFVTSAFELSQLLPDSSKALVTNLAWLKEIAIRSPGLSVERAPGV